MWSPPTSRTWLFALVNETADMLHDFYVTVIQGLSPITTIFSRLVNIFAQS